LESFGRWWKRQFTDEAIIDILDEARAALGNEVSKAAYKEVEKELDGILVKCAGKAVQGAGWDNIKSAQEPFGFGSLKMWALKDHKDVCLCWIDGAPGRGRSSLASAALLAWCEKARKTGLFISVRTLSQELTDT
jgi:hypothetical protein